MFALFFSSEDGFRTFIGTVDEFAHASGLARLLSKTDPRQVLVIENSEIGETAVRAVFRHGSEIDAAAMFDSVSIPQASEISKPGVRGPSAQ